ncbi:MAG TPA: zinc-ribbon domain-containing protein [Candidatus Angelobacter sp.]|nr:zinc-ribbon domain-containing protein [Candidatus Angelobacter sp.]
MAFCSKCGAQLAAGSGFCGSCGAAVAGTNVASASGAPASGAAAAPAQPASASAGMTNNVAGMLCYILGIVTGIVFLVIEPYKNNRFIRFHAFQSIFYWVVCFGFWMIWSWLIVGMFLSAGSLGMWGFIGLVFTLIRLAMFAGWIFLMFKAYNNEEFKLPVIGDLAAKQAGS